MNKNNFIEPLDNKFFSNNFGKKYVHKKNFINDPNSVVSLEILDDMLSKSNIWNNKNFKMMLDQKTLNYNDYSSLSIDVTGSNNRPDVDKVQILVSKGASIILNDIEKYKLIYSHIEKIANMKVKQYPGITNKCIFKHMDLHDELSSWKVYYPTKR